MAPPTSARTPLSTASSIPLMSTSWPAGFFRTGMIRTAHRRWERVPLKQNLAKGQFFISPATPTPGGPAPLDPPQPLHAAEQGIERAGADVVAVAAQLEEDPLPVDRL